MHADWSRALPPQVEDKIHHIQQLQKSWQFSGKIIFPCLAYCILAFDRNKTVLANIIPNRPEKRSCSAHPFITREKWVARKHMRYCKYDDRQTRYVLPHIVTVYFFRAQCPCLNGPLFYMWEMHSTCTVGASNSSFQKCFLPPPPFPCTTTPKKGKGVKEKKKTSFEENASKCNAPRALFFFRLIWEIAECFAVYFLSHPFPPFEVSSSTNADTESLLRKFRHIFK